LAITRIAAIDAARLYFQPLTWLHALTEQWRLRQAAADKQALQARIRFDFLLVLRSFVALVGNADVNWFADRAMVADVSSALRLVAGQVDSILQSQLEELARLVERLEGLGSSGYTAISLHVFTIQTQLHHRLVIESRHINKRYRRSALGSLEDTDRILRTTFDRLARSTATAAHNDVERVATHEDDEQIKLITA